MKTYIEIEGIQIGHFHFFKFPLAQNKIDFCWSDSVQQLKRIILQKPFPF